jgi:hypothetical protein
MIPCPKPVKTKKSKKKRKKSVTRGLSDSNLQDKWRKVVLLKFGNCCFFCGKPKGQVEIECHHLVKRKTLLLRHDWRNGIPVCKFGCHSYAETPTGKHLIDVHIDRYRDYLQERSGQAHDWFVSHNVTRNEFLRSMLDDLNAKLELNDYSKFRRTPLS